MIEAVRKYLETVPMSAKLLLERALTKECSPRTAIKAKCMDCCHFDRQEVASCTVVVCPLHAYRPFQKL